MNSKRVLIFIVTYNAEKTVESVLSRIPSAVFEDPRYTTEILIIDDCSKDQTFHRSVDVKARFTKCPLTVMKNPVNLGYGGNQKVGYRYAIDHGFDVVVLLHGDGQYAPEELPKLLEPLITERSAAVFGSRMLATFGAIKGGMPLYKYFGNKVLTFVQNKLVGTKLSEYHSGFRLYSTHALRKVPFELNSNYFDFDTEIIIQFHASGLRIEELPIPTFYGDEICHVNGLLYALKIVFSCFLFRIQRLGIFYDPKFDTEDENTQYKPKFDFLSSHSMALRSISKEDHLLILGCGPESVVQPFLDRSTAVSALDQYISPSLRSKVSNAWEADLDTFDIAEETHGANYSKVLALDVIEHLKSPEQFLHGIRSARSCSNSTLVMTTPNIAFLPIRLMLLIGAFNYGKRGILDRTHTRLFTMRSLRRILLQQGFQIVKLRGVPGPFPLALGRNALAEVLLSINNIMIKFLPGVFSYQIYVEARPLPTVPMLLGDAIEYSAQEMAKIQSTGALH